MIPRGVWTPLGIIGGHYNSLEATRRFLGVCRAP